MESHYFDFDPDVLAVLTRGGVEITFVSASASSLDDQDYSLLLWTENKMTIGVSNEYLNNEIDKYVVDGIVELAEDDSSEEALHDSVRNHAVTLFAQKLGEVFESVVLNVDDPVYLNLDYSLEQLLSED